MIDEAGLADIVQLIRAAARVEVMPRFRKLQPDMIRTKSGPTDLVTAADEAAEAMITTGLRRLFPGCLVVGEEACAADPALLGELGRGGLAFVVDPIDGTSNYCAGLPLFGMMAAAVLDGAVVASVIHDPVIDDSAVALQGGGAWGLSPAGGRTRLSVSTTTNPSRMTGCLSWRYMKEPRRTAVMRNMAGLGGVADYRCAAHQYRMLAAGHCDYLVFNRLMPWDHLPGWLLHQEAGGYSAHFDGSPMRVVDTGGGLVCVPDEAGYAALTGMLFEGTETA